IKTTLKIDLQTIIEQQVRAFIERNKTKGIYNTSVLLVDNNTMEVKALVGSADYFNRSIQGQVNGTDAKRSPGSTLKPFIYALGMDQSIIHPKTVLKDVATDFGFYTPENFDHHFKGPISVTDALIHSRNIPAVYVAGKLKKPSFYQFLKQAHIREMNTEDHYGLALVLGGGEVTAQELATLYAMLANQGIWQPLRMTRNTDNQPRLSQRLLSPEASFMTLDMLLKNTRNEDILAKKQQSLTPIYWKTGTSWGFRDAWTAGGFNNYTLIVWMGNFDGHSNNAFVGANAAAPLFFNIIDSITAYYPNHKGYQNAIPPNLTQVDICLPSGNLVTQWCKIKGKTWFIPGVSPINIDTVYRPVVIDNKTNKVACPPFNPKDTHVEVYEYWSSDLAKVFAKAGIPKKTPPNSAHCETTQNYMGSPPRITSPLKNVVYKLRLSNKENEKIVLNAIADGEVKKLYWFVDKNFLGSSSVENTLDWVPSKSGIYKISVIDDLGRSDSRKLKVDLID
ncbi:penicillin-binding protein 1C, partial [Frischella perrara]|uniref:penicillin-binding protein 1C n=1 Tax=Frischella perrara TaxID=1267021 RepID=UPI0023F11EBD